MRVRLPAIHSISLALPRQRQVRLAMFNEEVRTAAGRFVVQAAERSVPPRATGDYEQLYLYPQEPPDDEPPPQEPDEPQPQP